jgi:hypothetical protein
MKDKIVQLLENSSDKRLTRLKLWAELGLPLENGTPEYYALEQKLVDERIIERRQGRKGGIYLIQQELSAEDIEAGGLQNSNEIVSAVETDYRKERSHYGPALNKIVENWHDAYKFGKVIGAITASQGSKKTGGKWTRPDLVICTVSEWIFSAAPEGDVRTIEIKTFESLDVSAVYEALAHKSSSHYAYLLIVNFPREPNSDERANFEAVLAAAGRHGIGVITSIATNDFSTWETELDPTRSDADNQTVNQFLLDQFPADKREEFSRHIKGR